MEVNKDPPHFPGPLALGQSRSSFSLIELSDAPFTRDGPRADTEYRDLKLSDATDGRFGTWDLYAVPGHDRTG